jgi:sulfur carrier protein
MLTKFINLSKLNNNDITTEDIYMELTINGETKILEESRLTIEQLLSVEKVKSPDMVSVQLNGEFVKREKFPETILKSGDELDFLYFMGGGR